MTIQLERTKCNFLQAPTSKHCFEFDFDLNLITLQHNAMEEKENTVLLNCTFDRLTQTTTPTTGISKTVGVHNLGAWTASNWALQEHKLALSSWLNPLEHPSFS